MGSVGEDGFRRKNSLERYRPGAYFNEEREKLRRRCGFGEKRLDQNKENNRSSNGFKKGEHQQQSRGRAGGRGSHRGRGQNFNSYRNGTKPAEYDHEDYEEVEAAPPPPIGNWADELSDASPEHSPKKNPLEPDVRDLREKLNSMKMAGNNGTSAWGENQRYSGNGHENQRHTGNGHENQRHTGNGHENQWHTGNGQEDQRFTGNGHNRGKSGRGDYGGNNGTTGGENHQRHSGNGNGRGQISGPSNRIKSSRVDRGTRDQQYQEHLQHQKACKSSLKLPTKNTVNFNPSHEAPQMRIIAAEKGLKKYNRRYQTRDVVMANDIFGATDDLTIYNKLLEEIEHSGVDNQRLWQLWHGDSHVIADDHLGQWKEKCPTFSWVVEKMAAYFDMDVKATRLNWYRDSSEWKPFHHDAAAMKEKFARTQNFTLGVSFGAERDAAFEHAQTKTIISMPQPNGSVYTFGRDVNIIWRHGIPQLPPQKQPETAEKGRISIIAWGWIDMEEV